LGDVGVERIVAEVYHVDFD